jgi:hypothetical protein
MTSRTTSTKLVAITLAALALAAPAASARTATDDSAAAAAAQPKQDLRSPDARDAARPDAPPAAQPKQDLRSPDARDAARPDAPPALPGPPTWPMNPQPIAPVTESTPAGDGGGIGTAPALGILLGGMALLGGAGAVVIRHRRPRASLTG